MPEGVGYGPQYTASVSKTLNYIGNHAYAISGGIVFNNSETTLLEFRTEETYLDSKIQLGVTPYTSDDATTKIYFNDVIVWSNIQLLADTHMVPNYIALLITPNTKVKITLTNADASNNTAYCIISGKVYGKVD